MKTIIKTFIRKLSQLETAKSPQEKFRDFCELAYCAYAKRMAESEHQEGLETRYMQIVGTYRDKDAVRSYPELIALVHEGVQTGDLLGGVAAEIGALNDAQGQFFTPFEVSRLMAEMLIGEKETVIEKKGYLIIQEPAAGAGGMILAVAQAMRRRGYNPSERLFVSAVDISAVCYWMCYLQLALAGIPAIVNRGNTLSLEMFETACTSAMVPFLNLHGDIFNAEPQEEEVFLPTIKEIRQLSLF